MEFRQHLAGPPQEITHSQGVEEEDRQTQDLQQQELSPMTDLTSVAAPGTSLSIYGRKECSGTIQDPP
eukprot:3899733-Pyramimonas_sp.AAC.1